ncbi:MAG: hypothetical protein K2Y17_04535 [Qipengyuania sp.]|nr:hypothetical protein [Qipengyuania sp.]
MYALFASFIDSPGLALLPAGLFALAWAAARSRSALAMAAAWSIYALLEFGNKARITCSGECNIRIDLLVIAPALLLGSATAIVLLIRRAVQQQ